VQIHTNCQAAQYPTLNPFNNKILSLLTSANPTIQGHPVPNLSVAIGRNQFGELLQLHGYDFCGWRVSGRISILVNDTTLC